MQAYAYRVERQGSTLSIYWVERPHLRILALDAGGIAGYFNARLLQKIHNRLQEKVLRFQEAFHTFKSRLSTEAQDGLERFTAYIDGLQVNFLDDVDYLMGTSAGSVNAAILDTFHLRFLLCSDCPIDFLLLRATSLSQALII